MSQSSSWRLLQPPPPPPLLLAAPTAVQHCHHVELLYCSLTTSCRLGCVATLSSQPGSVRSVLVQIKLRFQVGTLKEQQRLQQLSASGGGRSSAVFYFSASSTRTRRSVGLGLGPAPSRTQNNRTCSDKIPVCIIPRPVYARGFPYRPVLNVALRVILMSKKENN